MSTPEKDLPRIALVFPIFMQIYPKAFEAFAHLLLYTARRESGYAFDIMVRERQLIHAAMNQAHDAVLQTNHVAMITFDDDCLPPHWAIRRLLRHFEQGHDVIAGTGVMRGYPHTTTVGRYYDGKRPVMALQDGQLELRGFRWLDDIRAEARLPESGLIEADFCGLPIALISRKVLQAVKRPAFAHSDGKGGMSTHDVFFCQRAQDAGFKIYVDPEISCGHLAEMPVVTIDNRVLARNAVKAATAPKEAA